MEWRVQWDHCQECRVSFCTVRVRHMLCINMWVVCSARQEPGRA